MKKILVLVLAMMCGVVGFAEGTFEFFPVKEMLTENAVEFFRVPMEDKYQEVVMVVRDSNGDFVADIFLPGFSSFDMEGSQYTLNVYVLKNGWYYAESAFEYEGVTRDYMLLSRGDEGFIREVWLWDPGYSDGYALYNSLSGEKLVKGNGDEGDPESMMDAVLNVFFNAEGIEFEDRTAVSVDGELICTLTGEDVMALEVMEWMDICTLVRATGNVNVRKGPGKQYEILGVAEQGEAMEYLSEISTDDEGTEWYCVAFDDGEGWISSKYAVIEYPNVNEGIPTSDQLAVIGTVVMDGDVYVRSGPGLSYEQLGVVKTGGELPYLGQISTDDRGVDWYRVEYKDFEEAWVSSRFSGIVY